MHPSAGPHQRETRQRDLQVRSINRLRQGIMKLFLISLASLGMISQVMALPRAGAPVSEAIKRSEEAVDGTQIAEGWKRNEEAVDGEQIAEGWKRNEEEVDGTQIAEGW